MHKEGTGNRTDIWNAFKTGSSTVRSRSLGMNTSTLSALAEPSRLQIVEFLREGPHTVGEIADRLQIRQPQASKHLRVLSKAGIVEVQADANRRIYKLRPEPFLDLEAWLESYRHIWEQRFNRLEDYLEEMQSKNEK